MYYGAHYHDSRHPSARPSPLAFALHQFKYHGDRRAGHRLAALVARLAGSLTVQFDVVIPVPLHRHRQQARGFNQSAWLARAAARGLACRFAPCALRRTCDTSPQRGLGGRDRRSNPRGAFRANDSTPTDKVILLVDDVITTGATLEAAAAALLDAGAAQIDCAVLLNADDRYRRR